MSVHQIKRGLDIPIAGAASGAAVELPTPATVAYAPTEFRGVVPKLAKREGDAVKAGEPLFFDKYAPEMVFLSPASGTVKEVRRGRRRVITHIVVEVAGDDAVAFTKHSQADLDAMSAEAARALLLAGGMWGMLRTRPLDRVPAVDSTPQSILISATETGPLQPGSDVLLAEEDASAMAAAVAILSKLGTVNLAVPAGSRHPALAGLSAGTHEFAGPHPSGDAGVQVNLIDPPRGKNQVWYLSAWDAVLIGRLALEGRFPAERTYAAVGVGAAAPRFAKTLLGAPASHIVGDVAEDVRWIRGSVLTGTRIEASDPASFYSRAVHVLPEGVERDVFGWAMPQFGKWSAHAAYLKGLFGGGDSTYDLRPGLYGGHRAIVPIGQYKKVIATPDIEPEFLFRSIISGDLEESISLGLLDLTVEEAALCSYVCPSKIDFDILLREGLDFYEREA